MQTPRTFTLGEGLSFILFIIILENF